jgi:toxin ParE1/3/4
MAHRLSPEAEEDLDNIWYYTAKESGSIMRANRLIDRITARFALLIRHPQLGRRRDDLTAGLRSFTIGRYIIFYRIEEEDVLILRVLHGSRDIAALFQ